MMRISKISAAIGALVVCALSASNASAGNIAIHTTTPKVNVPTPPTKLNTALITQQAPNTVRKLPGRTKYDSITVNRGVTSNQNFQQWGQGVTGGVGKLPGRTKYDSITVNRGVTSNQSFQQWGQGVTGGVGGGAVTRCHGC